MPRQPRQLSDSGVHHVMLRGNNRQNIFLDEEDYQRFVHILEIVAEQSDCQMLAYCLMTNHVHLVVQTGNELIGQVMKRLAVRYARWYNSKYGRIGHVFQDRFKSYPVEDDAYLITLLRYVWNNPVKAGIVRLPEHYRWSSLRPNRVVDQEALRRVVGPITLAQLAGVPEFAMPEPEWWFVSLTDVETKALLARLSRELGKQSVAELTLTEQQEVLAHALDAGASVRQLARVTQIGRTVLRRITRTQQ